MTSQPQDDARKSAQDAAATFTEQARRQFEENTQRVKEFNAQSVNAAKAGSQAVIDNYEKAAQAFFAMQREFAHAAQNQWLKDAARTQVQFAQDVSDAWVKAARSISR